MFPSTNTTNSPFEFLSYKPPSLCDHLTNKQDLDTSFLFSFPSPFYDEHEFPVNDILFQNQIMADDHQTFVANNIQKDTSDNSTRKGKSVKRGIVDNQVVGQPIVKRRNLGVVPRKRTGKKDRHSKICTAQGIRDRRMRLSLQVARKFFDLQDMLGYDKASKTIEWLFTKSKKAIKELIEEHDPTIQANDANVNVCTSEAKSESFQSECEVVSGIEETSNNIDVKESILATNLMPLCYDTPCETRYHDIKPHNPLAYKANSLKESRDKARARARCRTREKMMNQLYKSLNPNSDVHKLGSFTRIPFEGVGQESGSTYREKILTYGGDFTSSFEQVADVGTIEKLLKGSSSNSSRFCPFSEYNTYNQSYVSLSSCIDSNFMGLIGHMDMVSSSQYSVTHQVSLAGSSSNSPFEGVDQKSVCYKQEKVSSQYGADVGTIEKLLEINSSSPVSNAGNNSFMGFLGNWDNIDRLNSTDHVTLAGKPTST